jgi:hypothetical protein
MARQKSPLKIMVSLITIQEGGVDSLLRLYSCRKRKLLPIIDRYVRMVVADLGLLIGASPRL